MWAISTPRAASGCEGRADHVSRDGRRAVHPGADRGGRGDRADRAACRRGRRRALAAPSRSSSILETEDGYRAGRPGKPRAAATSLQEAVRRAVRERSGAEVVAVFTTSALPTDIRHNSKIDRAALSRWSGQTLRGEKAGSL